MMAAGSDRTEDIGRHLTSPGRFLFHYVRVRSSVFLVLGVGVVSAAGAAVSVQYVIKLLVDVMAGPAEGKNAVWTVLAFFVCLIAFENLCWRLVGWLTCRTTVDAGVEMRLDLFEYLNRQPMRYFADNLAGSLGQRITATAGNFGAFVNTLVWRVVPPCIDFLGALIIFSSINLGMTGALAFSVILVTWLLIWFGERGRPTHRDYSGRAGTVAGELVDTISNMWAVKAFSAREREYERLRTSFDAEASAQRASWMHIEKARLLHDVVLCAAAAGMLAWAITLWTAGGITPGDVVVVSTLTFRILHSSRDLALSLVDIGRQVGFIDETLSTIGQKQTVLDQSDAPPLRPSTGTIEFKDVSFSYAGDGARDATHELSLVIPGGQKVGIVGPSGAGKSTLVHLLQRLYDVDRGCILIDGQPIDRVTQDSLRAALAVVPQEIGLFHRNVRDNIRFARPSATDEEVVAAARSANCEAFVATLPEAYDTIVGERGMRLSGGQRQRVGIARAFLKNAPIIILDEATSALDTESEIQIQNSVMNQMKGRTVVAVAHRLSTLATFDRVIVIQDGRVVQDGPPGQLLAEDGLYRRMWRLQARGLSIYEVPPASAEGEESIRPAAHRASATG
ncbi:ABC transporter ATP-binding protein [uncultured Enterovirga sp.]|uniref:ABC transporter ATP-binding protein n=1 Tax=uncultured Enterovirga sp. TaxID=2026352 RepID=UPI0035C9DA05